MWHMEDTFDQTKLLFVRNPHIGLATLNFFRNLILLRLPNIISWQSLTLSSELPIRQISLASGLSLNLDLSLDLQEDSATSSKSQEM
jgi:hypothetical protein